MFNRGPGIGLDIGSKKIKLARVRKNHDGLQVIDFGSRPTPAGMVEAGNILDVEGLGKELGTLVRELGLKGKRVVSAVSGPQVYTRNLVMPRMKLKDLKEAVFYQASSFLPIPVEEATMDIFPLRDLEDEEGKKTEIFFVAVRQQQVEILDRTCDQAGIKLVAVEIEPLALYRVIGQAPAAELEAMLSIGASRSFFSVFNGGILVFYRSLSFGFSAFYEKLGIDYREYEEGLEEIVLSQDERFEYLAGDIVAEVNRSVEYFNMQNRVRIESLLLAGGGARISGLDASIAKGTGLQVQIADTLSNLILPAKMDPVEKEELKFEFQVALGLAAREVI